LLEDCFEGVTLGDDGVLDAGALVDNGVETPDGSALGIIEFVEDDEVVSLPLFLSLPNILANIPPEPENEIRLVATFVIVFCGCAGFRSRMFEGRKGKGQSKPEKLFLYSLTRIAKRCTRWRKGGLCDPRMSTSVADRTLGKQVGFERDFLTSTPNYT